MRRHNAGWGNGYGVNGMQETLERHGLNGTARVYFSEIGERQPLIIGNSSAIRQAIDFAKRAASSRATVLLKSLALG